MTYSKLVIVGFLGSDPELSYIPGNGQAVTTFSVATNRQYTTRSGERVKETTWHRVTAWGRSAETCNEYLRKGSHVLIEGRLTPDKETGGPRIWTRNDGTSGASYEVTAERVVFLAGGQRQWNDDEYGEMVSEDDVPF